MKTQNFEWEVSNDDIALALQECCYPNGENEIEEVREYLDLDRVALAASEGSTIDEQSNLSIQDIFEQIREQ